MSYLDLRDTRGAMEEGSLSMDQALQQLQDLGFRYLSTGLHTLEAMTPDDEIIEAGREHIAPLMDEDNYEFVEVVRLKTALRDSASYIYKTERDRFETRLITHGQCTIFLRFNDQIFELKCHTGDLIRIPGQLCYWLETGIHDCHYIHLYSTEWGHDDVSGHHDSHPCAISGFREAG